MKRKLSSAYIDFYNRYNLLYEKTLDKFLLSVYKLLIFEPDFSMHCDNCSVDGSVISILSEEQESILNLSPTSPVDIGIYYMLPYLENKGFYGTMRSIRLDNLLILINKFSRLKEMKEYLDLFCLFKDYQVDYVQLLLDNEIDTELDIIPCPVDEEVAKRIKTKKAIIDKNGTLKFTYTLDVETNTGDKSLKFYEITEILDSIYKALLKTPKSL